MNDAPPSSPADGQVVRVFISSTFRDMHAERDAINRLVFPELRRRCLLRGAEFIGVDMRWGVTEDEIQREGTLAICLREIERSRPFFVCLLAERFGSVHPAEEVSPALVEAARAVPALQSIADQWYRLDETVVPPVYRLHRTLGPAMADEEAAALVRFWEARGLTGAGDSLTAREILRGVFEDGYPPTRALFYLRTAGVTRDAGFPPSLVPVFVETDEARRAKLDALKERIHDAGDRLVVQDYEAHYAGLRLTSALIPPDLPANEQAVLSDIVTPAQWSSLNERARKVLTDQGMVALSGMDTLAERMIEDLWQAIEPELDRPARLLDAHERERAYHERFVTRHTAFFRGREVERTRVLKYVADTEDREVLVVTGEPGAGKSAFMAECVRACRERHPEALVIPHFIGAAPESASLPATLRTLCETLRREVGVEEAVAEDPDKLRFQLRAFLEQAGAKRPIILFLDALNQLDPAGRSHELDWLPLWAPPGTRIVVSTLEGDLLKQLTRRVPPDHVVTIRALPVDERRELVTDFLARRRKTLTPAQLNTLLDISERPDAGLPLYTLVALEELCLFGDHEALIRRIRLLPATLPELFDQVLARVEQDHTRATVEAVCTWLAVARSGLLESEVLDLLGTEGAFPRIRWTRLYRTLEPYLKPVDEDPGRRAGGRLDFYHDQLRSAVCRRYLHMAAPDADATDLHRGAHRQLANYFRSVACNEALPDKWAKDQVRGLSELPFHQANAETWGGLEATLCDLDFIAAKCAAGMTFGLVGDYRLALRTLPESAGDVIRERLLAEQLATHVQNLIAFAKGRITKLPELESTKPQADQSAEEIEPQFPAFSRLDRIRAFSQFVSAESHHLVRYGQQLAFCMQQAYNSVDSGPVGDSATQMIERDVEINMLLRIQRSRYQRRTTLVRTLEGEGYAVAMTPDGRRAISGADRATLKNPDTLKIWDVETGLCVRTLSGKSRTVALTPDGRLAVTGSSDAAVRIWDVDSGVCVRALIGHSKEITAVAITPDGGLVVSGSRDRTIKIWYAETGICLRTIEVGTVPVDMLRAMESIGMGYSVNAVAITADGRCAVSGSGDGALRVWHVDSGTSLQTLFTQSNGFDTIAVTPDGRWAFSGAGDGTVELWDLEAGACIRRTVKAHEGSVRSVAITADGRRAVSVSWDRTIKVWRLDTLQCLGVLSEHREWVETVAMTADGRRALSGSSGTLKLWNIEHLTSTEEASHHESKINAITVTSDRQWAVTASSDSTLKVWRIETGDCSLTLTGHDGDVEAVAVAPDGNTAISGSADRTLKVWNLATGACRQTWAGHTDRVMDVEIILDRGWVVSRSWDATLRVWDMSSGVCLNTLAGHSLKVDVMAVTADGLRVLSGSEDWSVKLWDLTNGACLRTFEGHEGGVWALAVTPDGTRAVSGSGDETLRVWDLESGRCLRVLEGHRGSIESVALADSGRLAVSASRDSTLMVWDLAAGTCLTSLKGHRNPVNTVQVMQDQLLAVSGSYDNALRVWDLGAGCCRAVYPTGHNVNVVAFGGLRSIVAGDSSGELHFLQFRGVAHGSPARTPRITRSAETPARTGRRVIAVDIPTPHQRANAEEASRLNVHYQQELSKWKAIPAWRRWRVPMPKAPRGI